MTDPRNPIAFIGLGEAAAAIIEGWGRDRPAPIRAYDIKSDDPRTAPEIENRATGLAVTVAATPDAALAGADLVFSTVTADQAVPAAATAAAHLRPGAFWFDLNSCAPSSKTAAATAIEAGGGRYVDVAVMAPIYPKRHLTPLLVAGPHAAAATARLSALPMAPRPVDGPVGAAAAIKMIRSIMVKGMEALTAECMLAAVAAGVEDEVLASLDRSHPQTDWVGQAAYVFERMLRHGTRRAAEMAEVSKTLADLNLPADMAAATTDWQARLGASGVTAPDTGDATGTAAQILKAAAWAGPEPKKTAR